MNKLTESLIEKHLMKKIDEYCEYIFKDNFQIVFNYFCENPDIVGNDTTIGATSRKLESIAKEIILNEFIDKSENLLFGDCNISTNPMFNLYYDLIRNFREYLIWGVHDFVETKMSDLICDKSKELKDKKVIDEHGDFKK